MAVTIIAPGSIGVQALAGLAASLRSIGDALRDKDLEKALELAARPIESAAKGNAPVESGRLKRSIRTEVKVDGAKGRARIGSNLPYARRVERGFDKVDRLGRRFSQRPNPFLRRASRQNRQKSLEAFKSEIKVKIRNSRTRIRGRRSR